MRNILQQSRDADSMRVTHVVLSLDVGGLERNVINQVREGRKLGQRVSVVCLQHKGELAEQVQELGGALVWLDKAPGLRPGLVFRLAGVLRRLRPQVVHTHQLATLLYGGGAARLLRIPVVVHTEHGREAYATRLRTRLLGRIAAGLCDRFYCLTREMGEEVSDRGIVAASKVRLIHNGIDIARWAQCHADRAAVRRLLDIPENSFVVGTVGRLTEVKRQDVLIRAFARIKSQAPAAHLLFVGDGPLRGDLWRLALKMGVGDSIHFAGYQPHSGPFLRAMDVFALTSRAEGMPQAVLEAAVTGLPLVVSRVGGLPELVSEGHSGILIESGDASGFAKAVCELFADAGRRARMGAAARARVESTFSVSRMAAEYHRDFIELLGNRRKSVVAREQYVIRAKGAL